MMNEIFGEENFVSELIWRKKTGASDSKGFSVITEYILVFVKNIENIGSIFTRNKNSYDPKRYKLKDKHFERRGSYYIDNLDRGGISYSDSLNYCIKSPESDDIYPNGRKSLKMMGGFGLGVKKIYQLKNDLLFLRSQNKKKTDGQYIKNIMNVNKDEITERSVLIKI